MINEIFMARIFLYIESAEDAERSMCLGYYWYLAASRPEIVHRVQGIGNRYLYVWYEYKSSQNRPNASRLLIISI